MKTIKSLFAIFLSLSIIVLLFTGCTSSKSKYEEATSLLSNGNYDEAYEIFNELGDYEDSETHANDCKQIIDSYEKFNQMVKSGKASVECYDFFVKNKEYKESANNIKVIEENKYINEFYFSKPNVGDKITLADVNWTIIRTVNGKVLALSDEIWGITMWSNDSYSTVTSYENSELARYVNNNVKSRFNSSDNELIIDVTILSSEEVKLYVDESIRKAKYHNSFMNWWCSDKYDSEGRFISFVTDEGKFGNMWANKRFGVRPAIWLKTAM